MPTHSRVWSRRRFAFTAMLAALVSILATPLAAQAANPKDLVIPFVNAGTGVPCEEGHSFDFLYEGTIKIRWVQTDETGAPLHELWFVRLDGRVTNPDTGETLTSRVVLMNNNTWIGDDWIIRVSGIADHFIVPGMGEVIADIVHAVAIAEDPFDVDPQFIVVRGHLVPEGVTSFRRPLCELLAP